MFYLQNLLRHSYWSTEKLEDYQNKRLRSIVNYAYDFVPYYHRKFRDLGLKPRDIKTKSDLNKLPVLSKTEIRENVDEMISVEYNKDNLRMLSTSGSTGKPLFLYVSGRENEFRKAKHLRANFGAGQMPRDRWITIIAPHHFNKASSFQQAVRLFTPTPISVFKCPSDQISLIKKYKPDILDGYSSSLFVLAKELEKTGDKIRPKSIIGGAELIDSYSRGYIEKMFDSKFHDQYSSVELERMSWQCQMRDQYHIDADAVVMQFLDKNGDEVSPGERGEIVCTSLFNYAMPFIRYAIGDVGVPSDELCACGRNLPLMKTVEGRKDSLLCLPNGRSMTPRTFTIAMNMFKFYNLIDQFRVIQKKSDFFEFNIVLKKGTIDEVLFEKEFITHLKKVLCLEPSMFDLKFSDDIPLDKNGKFMAVVSKIED